MNKLIHTIAVLYAVCFVSSLALEAEAGIPERSIPSETSRDVKAQVERLSSTDLGEQMGAQAELVKIGRPAVLPLIATLTNQTLNVRLAAAQVLGDIGDDRAVEPIITAMKKEDLDVRMAAPILGKMGVSAVGPIIAALRAEVLDIRTTVFVLGTVGEPAVKPLIATLKDKDPHVRAAAALALGGTGDARAVEPLINAFKDEDFEVTRYAAAALRKMGKTAVEPLILALKAKDSSVRNTAILTLAAIGDARAVEPLIHTLSDEDAVVQVVAKKALRDLTGQDFGGDKGKWQEWWSENKDKILKDR